MHLKRSSYFSDLQAQGPLPAADEAVRGIEGGVREVPRHDWKVGHELQVEGQDEDHHQEANDRLQRCKGAQGGRTTYIYSTCGLLFILK